MIDRILNKRFGFVKMKEDRYGAVYERYVRQGGYIQVVHIASKASGEHTIQSYDKDLMDVKNIGNCAVGLKINEMIPFWLKARWLIHKYNWNRRR